MGHAVFLRLANGANVRGMKSDTLPRNSAPAAANSGLPHALNTTIFASKKVVTVSLFHRQTQRP